jgi:pimeloyl-ACP methyl ester carboxylesterase
VNSFPVRNMNKQRFTAALRHVTPAVLIALSLSMPSRVIAQRDGAAGAPPPPGTPVDIGGYRLHIHCQGTGDPAVVMLAGGGDFSFDWSLVQPGVARFARACAYDRAGLAWSDLGPTPRTMRQDAHELHLLLERSGVKGPVVLVGHSVGGLIARVYIDRYPGSVAGLVLVDSTHEDTTLMMNGKIVRVREGARGASIPPVQTMKTSPPAPPSAADKEQFEMNHKIFGPPKIAPPFDRLPARIQQLRLWALSHPKLAARGEDFWADELQAMYEARKTRPQRLGEMPLAVLIGGKESNAPPGVAADDWKRLAAEKREQKLGFADLSRNSKVVIDPKSGHHIALDNPELVVDTIRRVVEAARHGRKVARVDGVLFPLRDPDVRLAADAAVKDRSPVRGNRKAVVD